MKLIIDDADIEVIRRIYEYYPVDGVTTNPSILAKRKRPPYDVLKEIRAFIGKEADFHVQAVALDAQGMIEDAHAIIKELGDFTYVKIPSVPEGFKAIKALKQEGVRITATAIYTPMQAYLAGKCCADYVAPYINRIDNMGFDGVRTAKTIHDICCVNALPTQVLAASFKNVQQVLALCEAGIGAATLSPDVMDALVNNATVSSAVDDFVKDFEKLTGKGRTMRNCR